MKAVLGTASGNESRIVSLVHPPLLEGMPALADQGVIADGQIVAKDGNGKAIAHQAVTGTNMTGAIDGVNKAYTATLTLGEVLPGSVKIDNNNVAPQVLVDDGHGRLVGDGTGTVNYATGAVAASFTTEPAAGKTVKIAHKTKPVGVSVGPCDTDDDESVKAIVHGTVNADLVLTGSAAADAEDISALRAIGVYAI
jgi:hypothetical protein